MTGGAGKLRNANLLSGTSVNFGKPTVAALPYPADEGRFMAFYTAETGSGGILIYGNKIYRDGVNLTYIHPAVSANDQDNPAIASSEISKHYLLLWQKPNFIPAGAHLPVVLVHHPAIHPGSKSPFENIELVSLPHYNTIRVESCFSIACVLQTQNPVSLKEIFGRLDQEKSTS